MMVTYFDRHATAPPNARRNELQLRSSQDNANKARLGRRQGTAGEANEEKRKRAEMKRTPNLLLWSSAG